MASIEIGQNSLPGPESGVSSRTNGTDVVTPPMRRWRTEEPPMISETSWKRLLANDIPFIAIPGFASADECARLVDQANRIGFEPYDQVLPPIDRVGITVFEYDKTSMSGYFQDVGKARAVQQEIFSASFDPLQRFMERIFEPAGGKVGITVDPQYGPYHAGNVRRIEDGTLLHIDFAPAEEPSWHVAHVHNQLSWNVYLELDRAGAGRTRLYEKQWIPADEKFKIPRSYGYRRELLGSAHQVTFQPTLGDVYIFNTRNYHEVTPSTGRRTTFTSAIGIFDDNVAGLWS